MPLTTMPQIGDKVRYIGANLTNVTPGNTYAITRIFIDGDAAYADDNGKMRFIGANVFGEFEAVTAV